MQPADLIPVAGHSDQSLPSSASLTGNVDDAPAPPNSTPTAGQATFVTYSRSTL